VKKEKVKLNKRVREPRYAIQTRSDVEVMEDGYKWRKYGQKAVKNSPHPRYINLSLLFTLLNETEASFKVLKVSSKINDYDYDIV